MELNYYDKILAGITACLSAGAAAGLLTAIPLQYALGAGAGLSTILMYHGMFLNGPEG